MKKIIIFLVICISSHYSIAQSICDEIQFGNLKSEAKHGLIPMQSKVYIGGLKETARCLLPLNKISWEGGTISFKMKVDPNNQNYLTIRCFGSEADKNLTMLFIEGYQIGYRHLGDIDCLTLGNGSAPFLERFYYITLPLPLKYTQGKKEVALEIRSYGPMWPYGETFEMYQKDMTEPTVGFYKAYTHIDPCFVPNKKEVQGLQPVYKTRTTPGLEVMTELKDRVNNDLNLLLTKEFLSQLEIWTLAEASTIKWTVAYKNDKCIPAIAKSIDNFYESYKKNPNLIFQNSSVYNSDWLNVGPIARAIRLLWNEWKVELTPSRQQKWVELMQAGLEYSANHRRHYTNQSMIIDLFMYDMNKALTLLDPLKAYPEYNMLKYLYESVGLAPWSGINNTYPLGNNYWQLTHSGLTKELGYVGYYGEVLDWVNDIYNSTCVTGIPNSGDLQIRTQLLRMMEARSYFRYPSVDSEGNVAMRIEAVIGWRDGGHYPGDIAYCDRGTAWDATPLMTAANTLDPKALGMAQQMIEEGQFFPMVKEKLNVKGMRGTRSLLQIPEQYETIINQPKSNYQMPMKFSSPDFVFSDEENGVVAIKNGEDILFTSLYWRSRNAVNNLAKVHYTTPIIDRVSNICIETIIDDSGMKYIRPDWVNLGFNGGREWYKNIHSAHAGDTLSIARIPEGVKFKPGDENIFAGKALFYKMKYGKYLIGMNSSTDKVFELIIPSQSKNVVNLTDQKMIITSESIKISPMSTVVLFIE